MGNAIHAQAEGLGQGARIALVGLHPTRPRGVHRRIVRIGDDHLVPQRLQMARDPLTLRRGLEQNPRRWPLTEDGGESVAGRRDPLFLHPAAVVERAELALVFVQIDPYAIHGWPSSVCLVARR